MWYPFPTMTDMGQHVTPGRTTSSGAGGPRTVVDRLRELPPWLQDGALVVVVLIVQTVALATTGPERYGTLGEARAVDVGAYVLVVVSTLPLMLRRRWPELALAVPLGALLVFAAMGYGGVFSGYAILVGLYSVVVHRGLRRGVGAGFATFGALVVAYRISPWEPNAADNAFDLLALATAVALGDGTRSRLRAAEEQRALAAALAEQQEQLAHARVLDERARIARELHDLVAHSMSIVAVQAGVGHHLIDRDPERAREALATIETTSRQALDEMRRMLGVLRTDAAPTPVALEPQPGPADIESLVEEARAGGTEVTLRVDGDPSAVPSGVSLSVHRIVQEALTNVRKHAGPATVTVDLRYATDQVTVTVDDDGRGMSTFAASRAGVAARGGGYGLVGMRERATAVGGELHVGPRPGGGFRVQARLPYDAAAAHAAPRSTVVGGSR